MLIDTHCHLDFKDFDKDRDKVIKRAQNAGVQKIINVGCDLEGSKSSVVLAQKYDCIYASIGLHPYEAEKIIEKDFQEIEKLSEHPKVVAIGECGLEFSIFKKVDPSNIDDNIRKLNLQKLQKELFIQHIKLSKKLNKPLIIHCRNAHNDVIEILNSKFHILNSSPGVIHFFSGTLQQAQKYIEIGFMISFAGVITFARDYDKVIQIIPLEKILIETDAPFVAPIPYRGALVKGPQLLTGQARNEPSYVIEIAKKIAAIKNISFKEVAKQTTENALRVFLLEL